MDHIEIIKHLRALSKKGSTFRRTICRMAAQKISKTAAELEETKALLDQALADLKQVDTDCVKCAHKAWLPCNDDEQEIFCDACPHDCRCKGCYNNSNWEWEGTVLK